MSTTAKNKARLARKKAKEEAESGGDGDADMDVDKKEDESQDDEKGEKKDKAEGMDVDGDDLITVTDAKAYFRTINRPCSDLLVRNGSVIAT